MNNWFGSASITTLFIDRFWDDFGLRLRLASDFDSQERDTVSISECTVLVVSTIEAHSVCKKCFKYNP